VIVVTGFAIAGHNFLALLSWHDSLLVLF